MRILEVVQGFPPRQMGGTTNCAYLLSKGLSSRKETQVFVFSGGLPSSIRESFIDDEFEGMRIRQTHAISGEFLEVDVPNVSPVTYKNNRIEAIFRNFVEETRPDVVHFQHTIGLSDSLIHVTREYGLRPIVTIRDFWHVCPRIHLLKLDGSVCAGPEMGMNCYFCRKQKIEDRENIPVYKRLRRILPINPPSGVKRIVKSRYRKKRHERSKAKISEFAPFVFRYNYLMKALKSASCIISPSKFLKSFYIDNEGIEPSKIRVVPHGIIPLGDGRSKVTSKKPIKFGFSGVTGRHKGSQLVFKAIEGIPKSDASLILWGKGWKERFKECDLPENILLKGGYAPEDLGAVYSSFDVLIIPSIWGETFSFVAHEAFSVGIPVIASDIGVFPEIITDGINGLLFARNDAQSLRECMQKIIDDPSLIEKLKRNIKPPKKWTTYENELYAIYSEFSKGKKKL